MAEDPFVVDRFGGWDLLNDPEEVGPSTAVDLLNVDLDRRGRLRSRDGYANFTASAALSPYSGIFSYVSPGGRFLLAVKDGDSLNAIDDNGTITSALSTADFDSAANLVTCAFFGKPATASADEVTLAYIGNGLNSIRRWDGSAWTTPTATVAGVGSLAMPKGCPYFYPRSNRLVTTCFASGSHVLGPNGLQSSPSHVWFSDAGTLTNPLAGESYTVTNFVELTPGDGQRIRGCAAFQNDFYVFKEKRFFVFYNEGVDGNGNAVFNYKVVEGVGMSGYTSSINASEAVTTAPDGIYFLNGDGIWKTAGGPAVRVSTAIDPFFNGTGSTFINRTRLRKCVLTWHNNRLWAAVPTGSATVNDRLLVFDPELGTWMMHDLPAAGLTPHTTSSLLSPELFFSRSSGAKHIGRHGPLYTLDDASAISWSYTSGQYDMAQPGRVKITRESKLVGTGTATLKVATFDAASSSSGVLDTGSALTMGAAPVPAEAWQQVDREGTLFQHQVSGTVAASVNRLIHYVSFVKPPGVA